MPLVRIDMARGKPTEYRSAVGEVIYEAMRHTLGVPQDDRFQIFSEHADGFLFIDPGYMGIRRSKECVVIQITLSEGRSVEQKRAFYAAVADGLQQRLNFRREDVFINLVEVRKENWSFGNGQAQYA